jgi:hypothetical protein
MEKNRPGADLPGHFRFTSDEPGVERAFVAAYGDKPTSLNVYLMGNSLAQNWEAWREHWVAGGLVHRCDGETCTIWRDQKGEYHTDPKPCPGECKPVGRLQLFLPELMAAGYVGTVTLETHSLHDIMSLEACLQEAAQRTNGNGIAGIEFRLYRVKQEISTPAQNGKRARREKWLVKLTPSVRWVQMQLAIAEMRQHRLPEPIIAGLPEPEREPEKAIPDAATLARPDEDDDEEGEGEMNPRTCEDSWPEDVASTSAHADVDHADAYDWLADACEVLRERAERKAAEKPNSIPSAAQRGLLAMLINQATGHDGLAGDQDRHLFLEHVWGKPSSKELTYGETWATLEALVDKEHSRPPEHYKVSESGKKLVMAAVKAQMEAKGQEALPGIEPSTSARAEVDPVEAMNVDTCWRSSPARAGVDEGA